MTALLNAPVLTNFGSFNFKPISIENARQLVAESVVSYIGHQSTCDILSQLLRIEVKFNRAQYFQEPGEKALIFKLKVRPAEGLILQTVEEIEKLGYEFGLLERLN